MVWWMGRAALTGAKQQPPPSRRAPDLCALSAASSTCRNSCEALGNLAALLMWLAMRASAWLSCAAGGGPGGGAPSASPCCSCCCCTESRGASAAAAAAAAASGVCPSPAPSSTSLWRFSGRACSSAGDRMVAPRVRARAATRQEQQRSGDATFVCSVGADAAVHKRWSMRKLLSIVSHMHSSPNTHINRSVRSHDERNCSQQIQHLPPQQTTAIVVSRSQLWIQH
jgi:hypothetical protein